MLWNCWKGNRRLFRLLMGLLVRLRFRIINLCNLLRHYCLRLRNNKKKWMTLSEKPIQINDISMIFANKYAQELYQIYIFINVSMDLLISSSGNRDLSYYIPFNIGVLNILMEKFKTIKQNQMVLLQSRLAQNGLSIRLAVKNNHRIVKMYEGVLSDIKTNIKLAQRFTNLQKLLTHMNTEHNCECNFTEGYIKIQQNFFQVGKIQLKPVQLSPDFQIKRMIEKCQSAEDIGISQIKIMISILGSSIIEVKNEQKALKNQPKKENKKIIQIKEQKKVKPQVLSQVLNLQVQKSEAKIEQIPKQKKEEEKNVQVVEKKDQIVQIKQQEKIIQKKQQKIVQNQNEKNQKNQKEEQIKKQLQNIISKRMSQELKLIEKEINSQFQKLSQKFQKHFKFLNTKIEDSSYQTQKKLYQKFSYLFKQINNDIDIINANQTQITRNSIMNGRQSLAFDMIIGDVDLNYSEQTKIPQRKNSIMKEMNEQGLSVTRSRLSGSQNQIKRRHSISYKVRNEKITIKNQDDQPHIYVINDNIKSEQLKGACRIKIEIFKKIMGIGMIDQRMIKKPIKEIGERFGYYRNDRQVWNGVKMLENQGSGFVIGQIIQFTYDLMSKILQWRVNDKVRYTMKFQSLNINESWIPFVYLLNKDDTISILPI